MFVFVKHESKSNLKQYYIYSVKREMNATLDDCSMTLSGATKFICQMNEFVDRARRFIESQKAIQSIEFSTFELITHYT